MRRKTGISQDQIAIIRAMAENDLNGTKAAKATHYGKTTMFYHLNEITRKTGLNPRKFYDTVELLRKIDNNEF